MKALITFLKTTLIGGLLVVLPIWICTLLVVRGAAQLDSFLEPLTSHLPGSGAAKYCLAVAVMLGGFFAVGLLVRVAVERRAAVVKLQRCA